MEEYRVFVVLHSGRELNAGLWTTVLAAAIGHMYAVGTRMDNERVARVEVRTSAGAVVDSYVP